MILKRLFASTLLALLSLSVRANDVEVSRRHDYKQTFKQPYYHNATLPFFTYHDNVIPALEYIRLSPGFRNFHGSIWAKKSNPHAEWQVEFTFSIFGQSAVGHDGLAFWYTAQRGTVGPIYGSADQWDGLCIAFDTADKTGDRNNPYIMGFLNDGTMALDKEQDWMKKSMDGCFRPIRNTNKNVHARISYYNNTIMVDVDTNGRGAKYLNCFTVKGINLPPNYYFGVSASSGHPADDHDVFSFDTYEITKLQPRTAELPKLSKAEKEKIEDLEKKVQGARERAAPFAGSGADHAGLMGDDASKSIAQLRESQLRMMQTLDDLYAGIHSTKSQVLVQGDVHGNMAQSQLRSLDELHDKVAALSVDLKKLLGDQGIMQEFKRLQQTISDLQKRIEDVQTSQWFMHDETREHVDKATAQSQSSILNYIIVIIFVQVVAYIGWALYRIRKGNSDRGHKFI